MKASKLKFLIALPVILSLTSCGKKEETKIDPDSAAAATATEFKVQDVTAEEAKNLLTQV